ncbi:aldehyde dehydrogenase (AldH12) [Aspergillus arachidicola]|uniref:Aldehyde dehydrogenase (AldH12) n=1 Tax=Aspergillus arachidicola TaxID=656916 RepID=A0A2G7FYG6_9EURO|nr:aldehyde dehydrogenase (AldH12) [Aspergillus arachidicola]
MSPHLWELDTLEDAEGHLQWLDFQPFKLQNFVNGSLVPHPHNDWIESMNPKTGLHFACIPNSTPEQIDQAVKAADAAFPAWSATPPSQRSQYLQRIASRIEEQRELFAVWESIDQGKTLTRARVEIDRAVSNFRWDNSESLCILVSVKLTCLRAYFAMEHAVVSSYVEDRALSGLWVYGRGKAERVDERDSLSYPVLSAVFQDVGLPPGVINLVYGAGNPTGSALVRHPLVKGISFTGGTATGRQIRRDTVDDIGKHLSLELGGKNPTLVFDDVDMDKAVATAAAAAFENQGEICLCGSRIYIQRRIWSEFVSRFVSYVKEHYELGNTVGAVVSLPHYNKIRSYLSLAAEDPVSVFHLGSIPPENPEGGFWIEPAVLTVSESSPLLADEIFGPVVTLTPFDTEEEAIRRANNSQYGLASILLTKDGARMRRVGERLEAGLVWVNCWLVRELGTPFGGMKASGIGREGGEYSREVFTSVRTLHIPQV